MLTREIWKEKGLVLVPVNSKKLKVRHQISVGFSKYFLNAKIKT